MSTMRSTRSDFKTLRSRLLVCAVPALAACAALQMSSAPVKYGGGVLTNSTGMTLYTFDRDAGGKSACVDQCATNWPPFKASTDDKPGQGYTVILRYDGSRQWAYQGKPLYRWSKDQKPGDKTGDGVNKLWHVVGEPTPPDNSGGGY